MQIVELKPYLEMKPWGGSFLANQKKVKIKAGSEQSLGETWEVSAYPQKESPVVGQKKSSTLPIDYLVKFIDTSDFLSVQVHPDEEYARKYENDRGKDECWLILKARPSSCLYLGLKKNVKKEEFYQAIKQNKSILKFLRKVPVRPGDFFIIPTGLIHAIGPGITLAETQTSSGVTYRIWDWGRVDGQGNSRQLHIDKAIDVVNFDNDFNQLYSKPTIKDLFQKYHSAQLINDFGFKKIFYSLNKHQKLSLELTQNQSILVLKGSLKWNKGRLQTYKSYFIAEDGMTNFTATEKSQFIIIGPS